MIYLDASAAVAQFTSDAHTSSVRAYLARPELGLFISDLCIAEFIAAIAQHVRARRYTAEVGRTAVHEFEGWVAASTNRLYLSASDVDDATGILRRFELEIRAPDALHLAICKREGARLLSFDNEQIAAAVELGIPLAD